MLSEASHTTTTTTPSSTTPTTTTTTTLLLKDNSNQIGSLNSFMKADASEWKFETKSVARIKLERAFGEKREREREREKSVV